MSKKRLSAARLAARAAAREFKRKEAAMASVEELAAVLGVGLNQAYVALQMGNSGAAFWPSLADQPQDHRSHHERRALRDDRRLNRSRPVVRRRELNGHPRQGCGPERRNARSRE